MKTLQLNFSDHKQRKRQQSNLVIVALLVLLVIGILVEHGRIDNQIITIEDTIARSQGRKPVKQAKPTEQDLRQLKTAKVMQEKLNFPWHELLAAIELVKHQAKSVSLMTIQPNPSKNEVLISAKAPNLKVMLAFVSLLEQQSVLDKVLLINQRHAESSGLVFTLKMGWKI